MPHSIQSIPIRQFAWNRPVQSITLNDLCTIVFHAPRLLLGLELPSDDAINLFDQETRAYYMTVSNTAIIHTEEPTQ